MQKIAFRAMGCQMSAFIDHEGHAAAVALAQVPKWFEEWEQTLSRFRPTSELNQLNARGGQVTPLGDTLFRVVRAALEAARSSAGLVTPTLLESIQRAGYDRSYELLAQAEHTRGSSSASMVALDPPPPADAWREIVVDEIHQTVYLPVGVRLDLGGIAKGWAAQQAVLRLGEIGPALVDAGGDIAVSGAQSDGRPWPVAVADPLQVQENLCVLLLESCGVATSGIDYRRWLRDGAWKHHIIDPRTGEPAETDLMSATVVAGDAVLAETAAKHVMILGSQAGLDWMEGSPDLMGVLALQDGRVLYSHFSPED